MYSSRFKCILCTVLMSPIVNHVYFVSYCIQYKEIVVDQYCNLCLSANMLRVRRKKISC
jgi:hypothetical protein